MNSVPSFDLLIIGGGPGGYVAAIRAAQLGMSAAVVEREHLGGICLNWGCIPTKALLHSAEIYHDMQNASAYGIEVKGVGFDIKKIVERSRTISKQLNKGIGHLLKKNKVTVIDGSARLDGPGKIQVKTTDGKVSSLSARNIILATGARARILPGLEPDGKLVWSYREALVADTVPKSLLVVGSGAIGIEFASFFSTLGSKVTVVEALDRVLPVEDEEISALAAKAFRAQGMEIHVSATVKSLVKSKNSVAAAVEHNGKTLDIKADRVIVAAGIVGNTENLGLEGTKVKVERTHIVTDQWCRTGEPGVYAIGDVAGPPWLAHKASHEGIICVEKIAGLNGVHPLDISRIPGCTYCRPQVASIGLSENKAKEKGYQVKIGRFPFAANGKAMALGETEGMVKTVFDAKTGELLGAHMIGAGVTELIQGYAVAMGLETTEAELMQTVFPHPTLSEMMHESALDAFGRAIHF
ncbi:MAG: dihydrolipoyl dehydrogenase [Rhodospirillales bacterium RIFCSPLOWO2_12_FULL_58_28]|nr:MAG: dihydrolipoyl dehydrogenase [Rhodospirillales bacterium RIFCSPLOWO2_02_FULL_58_16]OHC78387.1 MAG: dihydrolipoyl dehydrogenase [Rhodospirillales bacterium RIFCSPLOWO2_12_FULL_58_28]